MSWAWSNVQSLHGLSPTSSPLFPQAPPRPSPSSLVSPCSKQQSKRAGPVTGVQSHLGLSRSRNCPPSTGPLPCRPLPRFEWYGRLQNVSSCKPSLSHTWSHFLKPACYLPLPAPFSEQQSKRAGPVAGVQSHLGLSRSRDRNSHAPHTDVLGAAPARTAVLQGERVHSGQ